jgi:hypothetical protein
MRRFAVIVLAFVAGVVFSGVALLYIDNPIVTVVPRLGRGPATPSPDRNEGERLRRECSSIVDSAGVPINNGSVFMVLEEDTALIQEAKKKHRWLPEQVEYLRATYPDRWAEAEVEATARRREEMIRTCILRRRQATR